MRGLTREGGDVDERADALRGRALTSQTGEASEVPPIGGVSQAGGERWILHRKN